MVRSVFADGTRAANWKKPRLRYVAVFGQLSDKRRLEPCATVHCFRPIGYVRKEAAICEGSESDICLWPILLQKSPQRSCRIEMRNNRIGANGFLNQRCASAPYLESILRARMRKILLNYGDSALRADSGHV